MNFVIIEDEIPAARRLVRLMAQIRPDWNAERTIDSVEDAVEYFRGSPTVGLAFLDIHLADGLSFDILRRADIPCPIIFTTAFDHYAAKAFRVNSIDYLLKPVSEEDLAVSIRRFEDRVVGPAKNPLNADQIIRVLQEAATPFRKRFLVRSGQRLAFVPVEEIAYFFSDDGSSFIVTRSNEQFLVDAPLEEIEPQLSPDQFFRINRKMLIAMGAIRRMEPHFGNRLLIELDPPFSGDTFVSRQRSPEFRRWLDR